MADVRVICAIGRRGQLGLRGGLPWEGERGPEYKEDVRRFCALTRGHVLLVGPRTSASIPAAECGARTIVEIRSTAAGGEVIARVRDRVLCVGGGRPVWAPYGALIRHWDV